MGTNAGRLGLLALVVCTKEILVEIPWGLLRYGMWKGKYQQCSLEFGFSNWIDNGGVIY